jgi:hypothetical protein
MHPEIKESLKLSDKGSYYKQEDFYYSTDESNEDTNFNSEQVPSALTSYNCITPLNRNRLVRREKI